MKTKQKKKIRSRAIRLLSGVSLAAFLLAGNVVATPILAHAQAKEEETDTKKPTVNAAINNEKLMIEAYDESGIKAIYVNDYEFKVVPDGRLNLRLQQFDAGYKEFVITALDNAGNMSDKYTVQNPYYESEEAGKLPKDAKPTKPTEAKADVKDYVEVRGDDGSLKIFYTFETENGKIFYLIVDRTEDSEVVHFLTDVSENDLLNTTSDTNETLPMNSAALGSGLPVTETPKVIEETVEEPETTESETESETEVPDEPVKKVANEDKPLGTYIVLGIIGAIAVGTGYYFKVVKKRDEFIDEEDDEDEDEFEELEEIEEDADMLSKEDAFFADEVDDHE